MKKNTNKIINLIIVVVLIGLLFTKLPFNNLKNATLRLIDNVSDFINNFSFNLFEVDGDSSDNYINNITFEKIEDDYFAIIEFKKITTTDLEFIKINNVTFNTFILDPNNNKKVIVDITSLISNKDYTSIKITTIKAGRRIYESTLSTTYYKDVDYNMILNRQQSIVGISTSKSGLIFETSYTWGSGIIFNKKETTTTDFFGRPTTMYEYLILTNYHVIEDGVSFTVHYGTYGNEYPKGLNERIELLGYKKDNTDLAILKLTTKDGNLISLEDEQFTTKTAVPIKKDQLVFAIGSPSIDGSIKFNAYKVGTIISTETTVGRLKDSDLCIGGCLSVQTSTYQGEGSSGGAVFDLDGNLIGVHFAGNSEHKQSFEIPMEAVLSAIELILGPEYVLKNNEASNYADFFF